MVGVIMDEDLPDPWRLMEKDILLPLERIDGVASATPEGQQEKEIVIELDQEATEAAGLNIYDLSEELGDDNFSMASGTVRDGGKKFLLRSVANYTDLEALKNRPLTDKVRLGDIADIRYEEPEQRFFVRVNGKPATAVEVMKEGEANTVETCERIKAEIAEIRKNPRLKGFIVEPLFNQGDLVLESLGTLVDSGKIGGIMAALVLFLFLRRFRLTAIITFSIPLSLFIALGVMYFMGETLNMLTLLGLFVCVGLLVDNSVVVAENIHRLYQDGMGRRQACIQGASEIALAVIMATLTTVVVFLPVALVEGEGQFFLMRLALPITVSLIASLFIALVFVPLCVFLTMDEKKVVEKPTLFSRFHDRLHQVLRFFYERCFERLNHFYGRLLAFFLKRRLDLVILILVMLVGTLMITKDNLELVGRQEEDANGFNVRVEMDRSKSKVALDKANRVADVYYAKARKSMQEGDYHNAIQYGKLAISYNPQDARFFFLIADCQSRNPEGRWQRMAEENLTKATELDPWNPEYWISLGRLYKKRGLKLRAKRQFQEALKLVPNSADLIRELEGLR